MRQTNEPKGGKLDRSYTGAGGLEETLVKQGRAEEGTVSLYRQMLPI